MTNQAVEMYNYHAWANQTLLKRIKELPTSVLSQEVNTSFPTIAHALSHMYAVDTLWFMVLTRTNMKEALPACIPLNERILTSLDDYIDLFSQLSEQYQEFFRLQLDLERTILLDNPFARIRKTRLSEIVLHVVNHGTYHRGNVSTMLRQLGHASAMNDYALFWYQEPVESM